MLLTALMLLSKRPAFQVLVPLRRKLTEACLTDYNAVLSETHNCYELMVGADTAVRPYG